MALETEVWIKDIQESLNVENTWITKSTDDSVFINDKTIHIPQAGADFSVTKNRSSLPATIGTRTDTDFTYSMSEYTTDPILIKNLNKIQYSYDLRASYLKGHINSLNNNIALDCLYNWSASTANAIVRTSGGTNGTALAPSATGFRRKFVKEDLKEAARIHDKNKVSKFGRIAILDTDMYYELLEDSTILSSDFMKSSSMEDGYVGKLYGFNLIVTEGLTLYTNAGTPVKKAINASGASTDNKSCLTYHPDFVSRALGTIDVFAEERKADYYGDILSALLMFGSSQRRADGKGIVQIVQQ